MSQTFSQSFSLLLFEIYTSFLCKYSVSLRNRRLQIPTKRLKEFKVIYNVLGLPNLFKLFWAILKNLFPFFLHSKMSSILSEQPVRTQSNKSHRKNSNFNLNSQKKFKFDRNGRKRSKSFSGGGCKIKNMQPVLPTKFLLGGNIHDPLNLNSLQDEEINRAMNAVTPKSSPIPTPPQRKGKIEVIIPPNLNDPLNLIDCADDAEYEQQLCSPLKKGKKKRLRKRRTTSGNMDNSDVDTSAVSEAKTPEASKDSAKIPDETDQSKTKDLTLELSPKIEKNKRKSEEHKENLKKMKYSMDKIVSPVIPQPGAWLKRSNSHHWNHKPIRKQNKIPADKLPQFKEKNKQFQYGNYNRYD